MLKDKRLDIFLSTLPARGATPTGPPGWRPPARFLSTLPARGATRISWMIRTASIFLSTLPARGATCLEAAVYGVHGISIHAPREGSDSPFPACPAASFIISIHAPREGSDGATVGQNLFPCTISIHAPREGSDAFLHPVRPVNEEFLSTLPARGATRILSRFPLWLMGISIHAPREGSDAGLKDVYESMALFLSTLPARGATCGNRDLCADGRFLSTLPARGATRILSFAKTGQKCISIHAPREGSDLPKTSTAKRTNHFYPRSPRGERPRRRERCLIQKNFYPRSPRGERQGKAAGGN